MKRLLQVCVLSVLMFSPAAFARDIGIGIGFTHVDPYTGQSFSIYLNDNGRRQQYPERRYYKHREYRQPRYDHRRPSRRHDRHHHGRPHHDRRR